MSIRCVCPNGHVLKVKESLAGKSGRCPVCQARVKIPKPRPPRMSEDAILDILGQEDPIPHVATPEPPEPAVDRQPKEDQEQAVHPKHCYKCQREFPDSYHMCPFCHTYIATLHDF